MGNGSNAEFGCPVPTNREWADGCCGLDTRSGGKDHGERWGICPGACCALGGETIRTDYVADDDLTVVLALLQPSNRLACQLAIHTGLRIGDVLELRSSDLQQRMSITEAKTGKRKRIYIPAQLLQRLRDNADALWVFPGRTGSKTGHLTRQAVWADIKRAQWALRLPGSVGPHSMRKVYAVRLMQHTGSLPDVQRAMGHSDPAVTILYAMADVLTEQRRKERTKRRSRPR